MAVGNPISLTDNVASRIISQIATESQTDFTISGGYRLNAISVYRNGVRLVSGRDYSAADGSTVVLLSGASLSDILEFHIFDDFRVADALVSNASHQNIEGNLTIAGILTVTTLDLSSLTVSDSISIGGTLTYEDVTNVDSIGIITARTDLHVGAGLSVVGVSTFSGNVDLGSDASTDTITVTGRFDSNLIPSSDDARDIGSSSLEWRNLYVDGTGNIDSLVSGDGTFSTSLGIGTANPSNYGSDIKLALSSSGDTNLSIGAGVGKTSNVFFADGTSGDDRYRGSIRYAHDTDSMRFHTAATERLRIASDGNVTLGYAGNSLYFQNGFNNRASRIQNGGASGSADLKFYTNNAGTEAERLRITSGGLVGINTTIGSDTAVGLAVRNGASGSDHTMIDIIANTNETSRVIFSDDADHSQGRIQYNHNGNSLGFYTNGNNERLHITSGGNVGINTNVPSVATGTGLHIAGTSAGIKLQNTNNGDWGFVEYADETGTTKFIEGYRDSTGVYAIRPGTTLSADSGITLDSNGKLGIGAQNNTSYDSNAQNLLIASDGNTGMTIRSAGSTPFAMIHFADGTSDNSEKRAGRIMYQHDGDNLTLHTSNTERLRISGLGTVSITGNTANMEYLRMGGNLDRGLRFSSSTGTSSVGVVHTINAPGDSGAQGEIVFETNSSERIRLKSNGDIQFTPGGSAANPNGMFDTSGDNFRLSSKKNGTDGIGLIFQTQASGGTLAERLHLQSNGQLLFKGTSGDNQFTSRRTNVAGSSGDYFFHFNAQNRTPVTVGTFGFHQDGAEDSSRFVLSTRNTGGSNTERFRITSGGSVGIGSASPVTDVDISQKTGAVALPQGTTAQRPSGSSPYIRYNTTNSALEFYNGTSWVEIITDYFPTGSTILG